MARKEIFWPTLLCILLLPAHALAAAGELDATRGEFRLSLGIKSILIDEEQFAPLPTSLEFSFDNKSAFRFQTEVGIRSAIRVGAGVGKAFILKRAGSNGGLELKLPVLGKIAFIFGQVAADDGSSQLVRWPALGPSLGLDMVWWNCRRTLGFLASLNSAAFWHGEMQSRKDRPNGYARDYPNWFVEAGLTFGVAF